MERIIRFEKMLADEGALILKFWLHLSKESSTRLKALEKDPNSLAGHGEGLEEFQDL